MTTLKIVESLKIKLAGWWYGSIGKGSYTNPDNPKFNLGTYMVEITESSKFSSNLHNYIVTHASTPPKKINKCNKIIF